MTDIKQIRRRARDHVRRHYVLLVMLCAVSIFLGAEFKAVVSNAQSWYDTLAGQITQLDVDGMQEQKGLVRRAAESQVESVLEKRDTLSQFVDDFTEDKLDQRRTEAAERAQQLIDETDPESALGRQRGVLAAVANALDSGGLYVTLATALRSLFHSDDAIAIMLILGSMAFYAAVWVFIRNFYQAVLRRAFMESRTYPRLPLGHLLHFRMVGRWARPALTLLITSLFKALWQLTIVGGVIKRYSYFLVPFIVAENPDIRPMQAIKLSRRMMNGHKWECFRLELSYAGWMALGYLTFGAVDVLWGIPCRMAAYTEYYAALREAAKANGLEGATLLNDDCLFAPADPEALRGHYAEIARRRDIIEEDIVEQNPLRRFFSRNFGIWLDSLEEKLVFSRQEALRQQTRIDRMELSGEAYPQRMNALWSRHRAALTMKINYLTPCTIWSLIVVFFAFCIVGWVWEVSLHLITHGEFVNRGTMHGPWLPIYGGGVVMIAVLLYRLRRRPMLEALAVTALCGFVEYMTSYILELSTGMRWWDYTGYFLNLNGRICGEGLAVFAVGGMAAIYMLVPILDALVNRIRPRLLITVCVVLLVCFGSDLVYSHIVPNTGEGITSAPDPVVETVEAPVPQAEVPAEAP